MDRGLVVLLYPGLILLVLLGWIALLSLRKTEMNVTVRFLGVSLSFTTCRYGSRADCPANSEGVKTCNISNHG